MKSKDKTEQQRVQTAYPFYGVRYFGGAVLQMASLGSVVFLVGYLWCPKAFLSLYAGFGTLTVCALPAVYCLFWSQPTSGAEFQFTETVDIFIPTRSGPYRRAIENKGFENFQVRAHTVVVKKAGRRRRYVFPRFYKGRSDRFEIKLSHGRLTLALVR
jgi:hypothetical protein